MATRWPAREVLNVLPYLDDLAGDLMTRVDGPTLQRLRLPIPFHRVAAAEAAGLTEASTSFGRSPEPAVRRREHRRSRK